MTQYGFYFDSSACVGCKACQLACKEIHDLPIGTHFRRVLDCEGGTWEGNDAVGYTPHGLFGYHLSIACNHCMNPRCVEFCTTGAMSKDPNTGIVTVDEEVCIGCRSCELACPYHAPRYRDDLGIMQKCDMCISEREHGREPACVAVCAMRALKFGEYGELKTTYGEGVVEVEPLPKNTTNPCLIINPTASAPASGEGGCREISFPCELSLGGTA